jgi:GDP-4-dehydro-6-deoxy-D-mannose reductase
MKALVIGANGFVGRHLVSHLQQRGDEVYGTVVGAALPELEGRCFSLDITDYQRAGDVIREVAPEVVYHLAAIAFVPEAENNFELALRINVGGTSNIVRHCHLINRAIKVIFISSAEVYGQIQPGELPIRETTPLRAANNYSLSKQMAELVVDRYQRQGTINSVIVRPFNHIGPGQDSRFVVSSFAQQLAMIAHRKAPATLSVGNLEARRDFSDVRDVVRAYRLLAEKGRGVVNIGSGQARSIREVLESLIKISGLDVEVRQDPERMRGPEVPELYGSIERAREECGWQPEISFEQSLRDVYHSWHQTLAL